MSVKVRFAPSPTGLLHVGNIRIAIFNYLFAKKSQGKFVLRIDDTDAERSSKESEDLILQDLEWLGIKSDEFYKQSNHSEKYKTAIDYLKSIGRVYACYETKEELALKKKVLSSKGIPPVYDRAALKLTKHQIDRLENDGMRPYWRFKLNNTEYIEWNDLVHGKISIPLSSISDPVLIKPDGSYIYTFASVVDDINIGITHIIRGDDHITNTATQIDIFRAICGGSPEFAHIPLISAIDGQDVSKRTGSSLSIVNIRNAGIHPSAVLNVLATLGTSNNADHRDTLDSLIQKFSLKKMSLSSAKFNIEDVKLMTKKIISEKTFFEVKDDLYKLNLKYASEEFWNIIKENLQSINESILWYDILFNKINIVKIDIDFLNAMIATLNDPIDFEKWIADLKQITGKKGRDLFRPIRIVLTGVDTGPELKKIVNFLEYKRIKTRIESNIEVNR